MLFPTLLCIQELIGEMEHFGIGRQAKSSHGYLHLTRGTSDGPNLLQGSEMATR